MEHLALRMVVVTMNTAVSSLARVARAHREDSPKVAAHVRQFSEEIAGVTLDALQSWPHDKT